MSKPPNKLPDSSGPGLTGSRNTPPAPEDSCDLCGSTSVEWRNCKLICLSCRAIVRSCADL